MSFGDLRRDASEYTPDSSDSDVESQNSSCVRGKPKRVDKTFACWKFRDTIQADLSGLGSLGERRQKLIEHFRTRTSLERPLCVRSVTVFADLDQLVLDAPDETRTISITIIGYVQTKQSRKFAMTNWIKSANWEPIPGGLFSNCEFLNYMDYAKNPSKSWYELPIFGDVGLNNQGRIAEKSDRKVCVVFLRLDCSTIPFLVTGFRLQRLAANEQAGKQAQRRVRQQQAATSENTNSQMRLGAARSPASLSSVESSSSFASMLSAHMPRPPARGMGLEIVSTRRSNPQRPL